MPAYLHFEAPSALEYFATLVADDESLSVLETAAALRDESPQSLAALTSANARRLFALP